MESLPSVLRTVMSASWSHPLSLCKALDALEESGVVWKAGSGHIHLYQFRQEHPLAAALAGLLEAESAAMTAKVIGSKDDDPETCG